MQVEEIFFGTKTREKRGNFAAQGLSRTITYSPLVA